MLPHNFWIAISFNAKPLFQVRIYPWIEIEVWHLLSSYALLVWTKPKSRDCKEAVELWASKGGKSTGCGEERERFAVPTHGSLWIARLCCLKQLLLSRKLCTCPPCQRVLHPQGNFYTWR